MTLPILAIAFAAAAQPSGIANPASMNCATKGGATEIFDTPRGQVGYCRLPDKSAVEEWTLMKGAKTRAAKAFLKRHACAKAGGKTLVVGRNGKTLDACVFPDKSAIDAASLKAGPKSRPALAAILK